MGENGFPNAEVEFMHDVGGEELPMIDTVFRKPLRERALEVLQCEPRRWRSD